MVYGNDFVSRRGGQERVPGQVNEGDRNRGVAWLHASDSDGCEGSTFQVETFFSFSAYCPHQARPTWKSNPSINVAGPGVKADGWSS